MALVPLKYKIHISGDTLYIWRPETTVGIAPSLEEWEAIKEQVDRLIQHKTQKENIENGALSSREQKASRKSPQRTAS